MATRPVYVSLSVRYSRGTWRRPPFSRHSFHRGRSDYMAECECSVETLCIVCRGRLVDDECSEGRFE